jgi:RNA polymerase sigma-70 factor (ECF subfamily)
MPDESLLLQACLDRLRGGDESARDELFRHACGRLEKLTRAMLRDYPGVRRWEETGDVYQNAMLRLCRALKDVPIPSVRDFYRLAALQVRRELVDLARHHYGPQGAGAHHASQAPDASMAPGYEAADVSHDPGRLALWTELHRQVERLPDEEREVFDLLFYQGLKQEEAAALVGVTVRTIKSRWRDVRLKLHEALGGELPGV